MPDDNPPVSQGGTQGRRPLNVNEANVGNVKVTRMDVNTGEIKELQADLLKEVCDCIDAQTKTLAGHLKSLREDLKKEIKNDTKHTTKAIQNLTSAIKSGRGGGSGGSGGNSGSGGFSIDTDQISKDISTVLEKVLKGIDVDKYIGEMAQTFAAIMPRMMAGEGGAAAGMGGGSDIAAIRAAMDEYANQAEILEDGSIAYTKFFDMFRKGALVSFKENINRINTEAFRLGRSFTDLHGVVGNLTRAGKSYYDQTMDIVKTGHANILDLFTEFKQGRQDIATTFKLIRKAADENMINPLGILGDSVIQVSENLETARQGILTEGFNMSQSFRSLEEMNEGILELVTINKRAGIMGDLDDAETQKMMARQFEALKQVSLATGKTIPELLKAQKEDTRQLEDLVNAGILTQKEMENLRPILKEMPPALTKVIMDAIRAGGPEFGFEMLVSSGHELATQISTQLPVFRSMLQEGLQGNRDAFVSSAKMIENLGKDTGNPLLTAQMEGSATMATLTAEINTVRNTLDGINKEADKREEETTASWDENVTDWLVLLDSNVALPMQELAKAIGMNVVALAINTAALIGKLPGMGKILGSIGNLGKGAAGGIASGAKALAGRGALSLLGGAGAVAGAGLAGYGAGMLLNKTIEMITGGSVGTGLGNLFGADATTDEQKEFIAKEMERIKSRKKSVAPSTALGATSREATPTAANNPALSNMTQQLEKLTAIEAILLTANDIGTQIRDTIGAAGAMSRVGDVTGPSPVQRKVPSLTGHIQVFEPGLDVSP